MNSGWPRFVRRGGSFPNLTLQPTVSTLAGPLQVCALGVNLPTCQGFQCMAHPCRWGWRWSPGSPQSGRCLASCRARPPWSARAALFLQTGTGVSVGGRVLAGARGPWSWQVDLLPCPAKAQADESVHLRGTPSRTRRHGPTC